MLPQQIGIKHLQDVHDALVVRALNQGVRFYLSRFMRCAQKQTIVDAPANGLEQRMWVRRKQKSQPTGWLFCLPRKAFLLVGRPRFELGTNGLKVRCSTD